MEWKARAVYFLCNYQNLLSLHILFKFQVGPSIALFYLYFISQGFQYITAPFFIFTVLSLEHYFMLSVYVLDLNCWSLKYIRSIEENSGGRLPGAENLQAGNQEITALWMSCNIRQKKRHITAQFST